MADLLKRLTEARGVSGNEGEIREIIKSEIASLADRIFIDRIGNLIAVKRGKRSSKKVMLCAHMDEVGFIITNIGENGMLKFKTVGGIDPRILISKKVRVGPKGIPGVLGIKAIHLNEPGETGKVVQIKNMYMDIGVSSKQDAEKIINLGDYASFDSNYTCFGQNKVKAKALDDRAGCAVLIEMLKESYEYDLYACFTVQEEVGLRGSEVAAYHVEPDLALVVEGTTSSDVSGVEDHLYATRMGGGPAISIMDRTSYANKELVQILITIATGKGIPHQIKKGAFGGNDAGKIHLSREGVATATVSIPCRYIHSPSSVMDLNDYENTIRLVREFLKGCEKI